MLTTEIQGILQINPVTEESGYAQIKLRKVEVVNQTSTILHLIDTKELNLIVNQIENNIRKLDLHNREIVELELKTIKSKLKSIIPLELRKKRGLLNIVGHIQKWLVGVMDDDDRQEILEHLKIVDENSHNIIETVNKQIYINTHFNESIQTLKSTIEDDRENIKKTLASFENRHSEIIRRILYTDQMLKLSYLKEKIEHIQENIVSAKHHIFHPSILTSEEIDKFQLDFFKLKFMKIDILNYKDGILIFVIKIPINYIETDLKMILALPNKNYMEINEPNGYVIKIGNNVLQYEENVYFKNLRKSKHCTLSNNCNFKFNNKTEIEAFDDDMILVKNANNLEIIQDCDSRRLIINKNYLLTFYNCKININNQTFQNQKTIVQDKYFYPSNELPKSDTVPTLFKPIELKNFENIREVEELKFHKNISYGVNVTLLIAIIVIVIVIIKINKKNVTVINKMRIKSEHEIEDLELASIKKKYGIE